MPYTVTFAVNDSQWVKASLLQLTLSSERLLWRYISNTCSFLLFDIWNRDVAGNWRIFLRLGTNSNWQAPNNLVSEKIKNDNL